MKKFLFSLTLLFTSYFFISIHAALAADPTLLKNITSGSDGSSMDGFTTIDNIVYFYSSDGSNGSELWRTDGSTDGTYMVKDINSGSGSSYPNQFVEMNGSIYFSADNGTNGYELWKTNGTEGGTSMVKDIRSGASGSSPSYLTVIDDVFYFSADDGSNGAELWKSDGTSDGTVMVRNIAISGGSSPQSLVSVNGVLFFSAFFGGQGRELWKSDGTFGGTVLVKEIRSGALGSEPSSFKTVGSTLFFKADDGSVGGELWKSDGTSDGTILVKDIYSGSSSGGPNPVGGAVIGSTLYFGVDDGVSSNSFVLWKSDGTSDGTTLVKNVYFGDAVLNGSTIYFSGSDSSFGQELWKSDGTTDGTVIVKDILSGSSGSSPGEFVLKSSALYFQAYTDDYGNELWKSDGTESSTVLVKDIYIGSNDSSPQNFATLNDYLIFTAEDETYGEEPWVLDFSDSDAPSLTVADAPNNPTTDTTPTFTGSASDTVSTISSVQFQVDGTGGSWSSCAADDSIFDESSESFSCTISTLSEGTHTIYFRATDSNSNVSGNASESITVDISAPSITLTSLSPDPTSDTTPTFSGTATDSNSTISAVRFQIDATSGSWTSCTANDGVFNESSESFTCTSSGLNEGEHTVYIGGTDALGNTTSSGNYRLDTFTIDPTPSYLTAYSPSNGAYFRQQRPTYKFRASAGSVAQFSSYTLSAQHKDGTGFNVTNIPVDAPSITNTRYTITSTGYNDGNNDNDFIYITTSSSPDWDSASNDGRLKEGKNTWSMTAYETSGNTISVGNTFYVDVTKPQINNIETSTLGLFEGYLLSTQTRPKISFTLSDNLVPYKYVVDVYRQNYVLGIETGRTLISSESITPVLGTDQLSIALDFSPQQSLPYGKYLFLLTGYDKADNTSDISTLSLQLLSQEKAEELLKKPVKKESKAFSLPELEKKAILRRQKEAQELEILLKNLKKTADKVDVRAATVANAIYQPLSSFAVSAQKALVVFIDGIDEGLTLFVQGLNLPTLPSSTVKPLEERIVALRRSEHEETVHGAPDLGLSTDKVQDRFKEFHSPSNKKVQELFSAATTVLHGFEEPVEDVVGFGSRFKAGAESFYAIVFDKESTRISNVTIEEIGTDYVVVSWETNHPATGKVNYGPTLSFGEEVQLTKYENKHKAKLPKLTPGKKYFFEVMSHGKNYTYDSFYTVETIIEEKD